MGLVATSLTCCVSAVLSAASAQSSSVCVASDSAAAMSLRSGYTFERMREIGRCSADQARNNLQRAVMARVRTITCEYCGVVSIEGTADPQAAVRASSYVAYRRTVVGDGFEEQHTQHVRPDKAASNGVAFPKGWMTTLQNLDIPDIVRGHVERAKSESRVPGLSCRLLGAPTRVPAEATRSVRLSR